MASNDQKKHDVATCSCDYEDCPKCREANRNVAPLPAPSDAREWLRVQQKDRNGCVVATLAMLTGDDYDTVKDAFVGHDFSTNGVSTEWEGCNYLTQRGFAYQKVYRHNSLTKSDRENWPNLWSSSPLLIGYAAQVELGEFVHAVAVRPDGTVIDPYREGEYRLSDYAKVNHLIAVFDIRESRMEAYAGARLAHAEQRHHELCEIADSESTKADAYEQVFHDICDAISADYASPQQALEEVRELKADCDAFEIRCQSNNELWKKLKVALGGTDEFPVDVDGMLRQVSTLSSRLAEARQALEKITAGCERREFATSTAIAQALKSVLARLHRV